jgi:hypothetical protein
MARTGISHGTLQTFRVNGVLPFTRVGGIMFYSQVEIEKLLKENSMSRAMDNLSRLSNFLQRVMFDVQPGASHISVYAALCQAGINSGCKDSFSISRSRVMKLARIIPRLPIIRLSLN